MKKKQLILSLTALALVIAVLIAAFVIKGREKPVPPSPLTVSASGLKAEGSAVVLKNTAYTENEKLTYTLYAPKEYFNLGGGAALNPHGTCGGFGCTGAPILIFPDMKESPEEYIKEGFVVVYPKITAEDELLAVTQLKAVVRHLRYNRTSLAGCTARIFVIAENEAAGAAAALGASGSSALYNSELSRIGAVMSDSYGVPIGDSVAGVLCSNPKTCKDVSNLSYEWSTGQFTEAQGRDKDSYRSLLSKDLAEQYGEFINKINIKNPEGLSLKLQKENGAYLKGSYYDYIMLQINGSLNNYLKAKGISLKKFAKSHNVKVEGDGVKYESLEAFTKDYITPSREVAAVQPDYYTASLLRDNSSRYGKYKDFDKKLYLKYEKALLEKDEHGFTARDRCNMVNPMYFLSAYYLGYTKSTPAKHWLITNRIDSGEVSLTDAVNLKLLLTRSPYVDTAALQMKWDEEKPDGEKIREFVRTSCTSLGEKDEELRQQSSPDFSNPFKKD